MNIKLKTYIFFLLSKRDYSQREVEEKVLTKGYEDSEIRVVVQEMLASGYIDDTRMAEQIIYEKKGTLGKSGIALRMKKYKIKPEIIDESLTDYEEYVSQEIVDKIKQKYLKKSWDSCDFNEQQKIKSKVIGYLQYRGFSNFDLSEILN